MMKYLIKYYVRKKLLNLKGSKLDQILHADKTDFRTRHKYSSRTYAYSCMLACTCI